MTTQTVRPTNDTSQSTEVVRDDDDYRPSASKDGYVRPSLFPFSHAVSLLRVLLINSSPLPQSRRRPSAPLVFACPHCPKHYQYESSLVRHMRHVHDRKGSFYPCTFCPTWYSLYAQFAKHVKKHSESKDMITRVSTDTTKASAPAMRSFRCPSCDYQSTSEQSIIVHVKFRHTFPFRHRLHLPARSQKPPLIFVPYAPLPGGDDSVVEAIILDEPPVPYDG